MTATRTTEAGSRTAGSTTSMYERSRALRRAAQRIAVGVLAGAAVCLAAPGTAAASPSPSPPDHATAAPARSSAPAAGDGESYWASDNCHYYRQGGAWFSDMCALSISVDGKVVPNLFGDFQNLGNGHYGRELVRLDASNPDYLAFSFVTPQYTLGSWLRVFYGDPRRIEQQATTIDGAPTWISLPVSPATQPGGPPQPSGDPVKDAQIAQLWRNYNDGQLLTGLLAAGASLS
jgi:hypothetical protein